MTEPNILTALESLKVLTVCHVKWNETGSMKAKFTLSSKSQDPVQVCLALQNSLRFDNVQLAYEINCYIAINIVLLDIARSLWKHALLAPRSPQVEIHRDCSIEHINQQ